MRCAPNRTTPGTPRSLLVAAALVWLAACGSTPRHGFVIPTAGGAEREPLIDGPLTLERLVQRAQAELDAAAARVDGELVSGGAAEVWVRRALQRDPEHPGALAVLGRLRIAQGLRAQARLPLALAAARAPELEGERLANLVALAREELDAGRVGAAAAIVAQVERDLPAARTDGTAGRAFREERHALHARLASIWLERGLREPARAALDRATQLGRGPGRATIELEALDRGALQRTRAQDVIDGWEEWLELARWLARFGRPEDVDVALEEAREDDPGPADRARVEAFAAQVELERDQPTKARERWLAAAQGLGEGESAGLLVRAAELLKADGFGDEGLALLDDASRLWPGDARVARAQVRWAVAAKDLGRAAERAAAFVSARPAAWERAFGWVYALPPKGPERLREVGDAILAAARGAGQDVPSTRSDEVLAQRASTPLQRERDAVTAALSPGRGWSDAAADQRAARAVRAWAALPPEPDRREVCAHLHRAIGARAMPEARLAILEAWQAAPADGGDEPPWTALPDAYLRLKRYAEAEAAALRGLEAAPEGVGAGPGGAPSSAELMADRFRAEDRWEEALRFYDRMHVDEIQGGDALAELSRRLAMRGDTIRAEEAARRLLERARDKEVQAAKVITFAEQAAPALAAQAFAIAVEAGDKTPRAFIGWLRALARLGDDEGAERVANRFLGDRPRRDARAIDDVARALADEGKVGRAAELVLGRIGDGERPDPNALAPLADMLRRTGRSPDLVALVARFVSLDARNPQRAYQTGAQRLIDAGLVDEADALVARGLEVRPRDPTLLSTALSLAMLRRDAERTIAVAERLFAATPTGSAVDVMERVIGDVRAAALPNAALALADAALGRLPGTPRLLVARGRVHLFAGRRELAVQDFSEAVSRAGFGASTLASAGGSNVGPRAMLQPLEALLDDARMRPELVLVQARAMAQVPMRADVVIPYGKALLLAGRAEEAEQVFARFLADNDRGHAIVAEAWYDARRWRKALEHWGRGMDQVAESDANAVLGMIATALAAVGEPERLDTFVRLFVQGVDGRQRGGLGPVARAYATVGRAEDALRWLARAEEANPTADNAWELGLAHLDRGDDEAALASFERCVARRAAEALPTQSTAWFGGAAAAQVVNLLVERGRATLAGELVARVEALYGASAWTRLSGARAALAEGDVAGVLERLAAPLPPWRTNRDLLPSVRLLLEELLAAGHGEIAIGLVERAIEAGAEKELVMGAARIAARAGHPERAIAAAERFAAEHPSAQAWQAAEVLAAEGILTRGRAALEEALAASSAGPQLGRAAVALHTVGVDAAQVSARARALGDDRIERALVSLQMHRLGGPVLAQDNAAKANGAIAPLLGQAFTDEEVGLWAMVSAALADEGGPRVSATLRALFSQAADRVKWARRAAEELASLGLPGVALDALELVADSEGGDGGLALRAIELAYASGRSDRAEAWRARLPPGAKAELAERLRRLERLDAGAAAAGADAEPGDAATAADDLPLGDARRFAEVARARIERSQDPEAERRRAADLALARVGTGPGWARAGRACLDDWIDEGGVERSVLEIGLALAWHDQDAAAARRRAEELATRFPGEAAQPAILVEAAVASGDADGLERLLAQPAALPRKARARLFAEALAASALLGQAPARPVLAVLARVAREAPAADPAAASLAAMVEAQAAGPAAGVTAAEAAHRRSPRSVALTVALAEALARDGRPERLAEAEALLVAASRRPDQAPVFELGATTAVGRQRGRVVAALGRVMAGRGEHARAAALYREAVTLLEPLGVEVVGPLLVARGDALRDAGRRDEAIASWTDALRRGDAQGWARAARQRLRR